MRIQVATMQRDEGELLHEWVRHHSKLFGPEALTVVDDYSEDARTRQVLADAEAAGVRVITQPGKGAFERKGAVMSGLAAVADCDWFFPLDTDEFIGVGGSDGFRADRKAIEAALIAADRSRRNLVRIGTYFMNLPHTTKAYRSQAKKIGVKPKARVKLDIGFHLFDWSRNEDVAEWGPFQETDLALMHLHNRPFRDLLAKARLKLKDRVPDFRPATLAKYRGAGIHLIPYFQMDERRYVKQFPQATDDLASAFEGSAVPFSEPMQPMTEADRKQLYHPVNLHRMRSITVATPREIARLLALMDRSAKYLEFGAGGTTLMALTAGVQRVASVETSIDFCTQITEKLALRDYINAGRLHLQHVYLGETGDWGYPRFPPEDHQIEEYLSNAERWAPSDLVMIDGRYRVAAAASAYLSSTPDTTIAIHDYTSRDHYHHVREFLELVETVDELAIFRPIAGKEAAASAIRSQYFRDAR